MGNIHDLYAVGVVKTGTGTVGKDFYYLSLYFYLRSLANGSTLAVDLPQFEKILETD